jgi:hypothetical protein
LVDFREVENLKMILEIGDRRALIAEPKSILSEERAS